MYNTHMQDTYLYIRYSHDKQGEGSSYDRQLGMARQHCRTLIEDEKHIYFDAGKSAFKGEHLDDGGKLKQFYDDIKSGIVPKGSTLLVEDLDRLSRDGMWKASDKLRELTENGIAVVTLRDGKRYEGVLKLSDALTSLLKQELAHDESAKKSGRVADSYVKRYAKARAGKRVKVLLPSWLEWVGEDVPYKVRKPEAAVVKEVFVWAAEGYSYAAIAKMLNQRGTRPFRSKDGDVKLWITASLFALVKNEAVLGIYKPRDGGPPIEGYFPVIVERELFNAAQGARAERKEGKDTRTGTRYNVWSKIGVCAQCGRTWHALPKGRDNQLYLVCSGKLGGTCSAKNIRADRAELGFREVLLNAVNADYFLGDRRDELMKARELQGLIDDAQQRRNKLVALLDADPMPEVVAALKKVNAELTGLRDQKDTIDQATAKQSAVSRSRVALLAKIDLTENPARMQTNTLLRRLGITVEIGRYDSQIRYTAKQNGKKMLVAYQQGHEVQAMAYSEDTAMRMYERGETDEPEMNTSLSDVIGKAGKRPEQITPDLLETPCTQEAWDWSDITLEPYGYTPDAEQS